MATRTSLGAWPAAGRMSGLAPDTKVSVGTAPPPDAAPEAAVSVLLVDGQQMVAEALASRLGREPGLDMAATVRTPEAARQEAERRQPDVVVVDPELLGTGGTGLIAEIRRVSPATRAVILTASSDEAALMAAVEAGCCGFVTKDRPVEELVEAVRAAHRGEASISPALATLLLPRLRQGGVPSAGLSRREREVLELLVDGLSNRTIAERLYVSVNTVRNHVQRVITKLGAHSKLEAVAIAVRTGIVGPRTHPGG